MTVLVIHNLRTIVESQLKYDKIITVESDHETYQKHVASNQCIAYHDRLEDFIIRNSNNELLSNMNCAYFDFIGTVEGRYSGSRKKQSYPLENIHNILNKTSSKKFVLGLTFTLRSHRGIFGDHECLADQIVKDFVTPCVNYSQFYIENSFRRSYNRRDNENGGARQQMLFICLILQKDSNIDVSKIKFITEEIMLDSKLKQIYLGYDPYRWIVD